MSWLVKATQASNFTRAQQYLQSIYPNEIHGLGGHCINPKCDYEFTSRDMQEIEQDGGYFTCPKCGTIQNVYAENRNKVGMSPDEMGTIGEQVVERLGIIPQLGEITWTSNQKNFPIDLIAGDFGVEVKTNHSEAQPRFKLGGGNNPGGAKVTLKGKLQYVEMEGLRPALVGVRLNFYYNNADIFVRPDSFTDTWIGNAALKHVATVDFSDLNPFKRPEDVPTNLPDDDEDEGIPF